MHDSETSFWVRFDDQNQEKGKEEHDKGSKDGGALRAGGYLRVERTEEPAM